MFVVMEHSDSHMRERIRRRILNMSLHLWCDYFISLSRNGIAVDRVVCHWYATMRRNTIWDTFRIRHEHISMMLHIFIQMDAFKLIWSGVTVAIEPILAIVDHLEKPDPFSFFDSSIEVVSEKKRSSSAIVTQNKRANVLTRHTDHKEKSISNTFWWLLNDFENTDWSHFTAIINRVCAFNMYSSHLPPHTEMVLTQFY